MIFLGHRHYKNSYIYDFVANNIKHYRIAACMTQQELADRTGYSPEYIRRIEAPNRKSGFTIEAVNIIAKALDINVALLFCDVEKKSNK